VGKGAKSAAEFADYNDCAGRRDIAPADAALFQVRSVKRVSIQYRLFALLALALLPLAGCQQLTVRGQAPIEAAVGDVQAHPAPHADSQGPPPTELQKISLPDYVIEPPDVLLIEAIKVVPKPPYKIESLDILQVIATGTELNADIAGAVSVDPSGRIDLGPRYGKVKVAGLTIDEAREKLLKHLQETLADAEVSITLAQSAGNQQISGEHLVTPDGTVNLGQYGSVYVAGMTIEQARAAIERSLSEFLEKPVISVDIFSYQSKTYYVITEGAGFGDSIIRIPVTGNETVLDAISQVQGLRQYSTKRIWIARPAPGGVGCDQVLPVKWDEIVKGGSTATNYQVLPGDRIFIEENKLVRFDNMLALITQPAERLFGTALLGGQTVQVFNRFPEGLQQ
jgi:polysaccharide biosynthesis/export protein